MPDCQSCKESKRALEPVPYMAHEGAMARFDRILKRLIIAFIVVLVLWFSTIGLFVWYLNQYDFESYTETYEYTQDGRGLNIIGDNNGVDYNGAEADLSPQD